MILIYNVNVLFKYPISVYQVHYFSVPTYSTLLSVLFNYILRVLC